MYDNKLYCNKCGKFSNKIYPTDFTEHIICEADTICEECGFKDCWAYGYFISSSEGYNASKKY